MSSSPIKDLVIQFKKIVYKTMVWFIMDVTQCMFLSWIMTSDHPGGGFSKYHFIEIQFWNLPPPEGLHL